ncbi:NAD(P)-binding domain protein [Moelleriella libera RCEF 2490]|uniref:NAD(P)-binding domain protein n=1 Tax=Moelleriella libera RCEF 2490 TaxID=1081109 RepID=A0A162I0T0_9HYPO|nr:NAD(P)-binding domain protein [Moelleriella libera RCEF 2490]
MPASWRLRVQGHELQLGGHCLGSFLLTKLLTPKLEAAAALEPAAAVHLVWLTSFSAEIFCEKDVVFDMKNLDYHVQKPGVYRYGISKAGAWVYGVEFARRYRTAGIANAPLNPGNLRTMLFDSQGSMMRVLNAVVLTPMLNGVCTILFAALSPKVTMDKSGSWIKLRIPCADEY